MNLLILFISIALHADTYLSGDQMRGAFETPPRRTTGLWGTLTGHLSEGDRLALMRKAELKFIERYGRPAEYIYLPTQILIFKLTESKPTFKTTTGLFGRYHSDAYKIFGGEAEIILPILSAQENLGPLGFGQKITRAQLVLFIDSVERAVVGLDADLLARGEGPRPRDKHGREKFELALNDRIALGKALAEQGPIQSGETAQLALRVTTSLGDSIFLLNDWTGAGFKPYLFLSVSRWANKSYLKQRCAKLFTRV